MHAALLHWDLSIGIKKSIQALSETVGHPSRPKSIQSNKMIKQDQTWTNEQTCTVKPYETIMIQSNMYLGLPGGLRAGLNQLSLRHPKLRHYQLQPQHQWRLRQAHQQWCPARHHSNQYVYQELSRYSLSHISVRNCLRFFRLFFLKFPVLSMFPAICSILELETAISRVFADFLSSNWSSNSHFHLHMFATFWCSTCSCNIW